MARVHTVLTVALVAMVPLVPLAFWIYALLHGQDGLPAAARDAAVAGRLPHKSELTDWRIEEESPDGVAFGG